MATPNDPGYTTSTGGLGDAIDLDGDDYATAVNNAAYDVTTFTTDVWFKAPVGQTNGIVAARQSSDCGFGALCQWEIWIDGGGKLTYNMEVGATEHSVVSSVVVADGAWHHAALTVNDATKELTAYLDGALVGADTTWASGSVDTGAMGIFVGISGGLMAATQWVGQVDELRFQAGVRSGSELRSYYDGRVRDFDDDNVGSDFNWAEGSNTFGVCLRTHSGGAVTDGTTWAADSDTTTDEAAASADCADGNSDPWKPVVGAGGTSGSKILATTTEGANAANARMRFGFRSSANQTPGTYSAPLIIEVIAPNI